MSEPFSRTPWAFLDDERIKPGDERIYCTLMRLSDFRTRMTRAGTTITVIAKAARVSRTKVIQAIERMVTAGWLTPHRGRSTEATRYEVRSSIDTAVQKSAVQKQDECSPVSIPLQSSFDTTAVQKLDRKSAVRPVPVRAERIPSDTSSDTFSDTFSDTPLPPKGGRGQSAPRAKPVAKKPSGPDVRPIFEALKVRGLKEYPSNLPAQIAAAQRLLQASYSADEIADCYMDVCRGDYGDTFLQHKLSFTMMENSDNIGNWKRWNAGGRQRFTDHRTNGHGQTRRNGSVLSVAQSTREEIYAARDRIRAEGGTPASSTVTGDDGVAQRRGRPGALEEMIQAQIATLPPEEVTP